RSCAGSAAREWAGRGRARHDLRLALDAARPRGRPAGRAVVLQTRARLLGPLVLLLVALGRPEVSVPLPRREGTVILAVDTSASMAATDLTPSRMDAAKAAARAFVERQPPAVRLGVVAFSGSGLVTQEVTADRASVIAAID